MYISSIRIESYKSYRETKTLELTTGFNVITGQNNAGKSALLEALSMSFEQKPHRSEKTAPDTEARVLPPSSVEMHIAASGVEVRDLVARRGGFLLVSPAPGATVRCDGETFACAKGDERLGQFAGWLLEREHFDFRVAVPWAVIVQGRPPSAEYEPVSDASGNWSVYEFDLTSDRVPRAKRAHWVPAGGGPEHDLALTVARHLASRLYVFKAERFNVGICAVGMNTVLQPNASNLPEVLANLQSNHSKMRRFNETVRRVLPHIRQVAVRNFQANQLQIFTWPHDPDTEREDLAVPLNECGTGVGQVLAILYVVLNSDFPRTILIDEPQSFLHPGAVRKLIEVLREHPEHQYIMSTHSPTVITACNPSTITLVRQQDGESDFQVIDPKENDHLRVYLSEIGARLSDAFGADDILWVEGPTEELSFPLILEKVAKWPLMGTAIIGVKHTGDFEGKLARNVFQIYERLSKGKGLLPPAVGFIFDKEDRDERQLEELKRDSGGLIAFTSRRLYESYLLDPAAIAAVLNENDTAREQPLTPDEVQGWIDEHVTRWRSGDRDLIKKHGRFPEEPERWRLTIHAAYLLERLFSAMSETRVSYQKTEHSVALTRWIIEHAPEELRELADLAKDMLEAARRKRTAT